MNKYFFYVFIMIFLFLSDAASAGGDETDGIRGCFCESESFTDIYKLKCGAFIHKSCLYVIILNKNSCPYCRGAIDWKQIQISGLKDECFSLGGRLLKSSLLRLKQKEYQLLEEHSINEIVNIVKAYMESGEVQDEKAKFVIQQLVQVRSLRALAKMSRMNKGQYGYWIDYQICCDDMRFAYQYGDTDMRNRVRDRLVNLCYSKGKLELEQFGHQNAGSVDYKVAGLEQAINGFQYALKVSYEGGKEVAYLKEVLTEAYLKYSQVLLEGFQNQQDPSYLDLVDHSTDQACQLIGDQIAMGDSILNVRALMLIERAKLVQNAEDSEFLIPCIEECIEHFRISRNGKLFLVKLLEVKSRLLLKKCNRNYQLYKISNSVDALHELRSDMVFAKTNGDEETRQLARIWLENIAEDLFICGQNHLIASEAGASEDNLLPMACADFEISNSCWVSYPGQDVQYHELLGKASHLIRQISSNYNSDKASEAGSHLDYLIEFGPRDVSIRASIAYKLLEALTHAYSGIK